MKKSILFFLIAFNGICLVVKPQSAPYCPSVNAQAGTGPVATICQGQCANLTASFVPINLTNSYAVQTIPYSPFPFSGGTQVSVNVDDIWSNVINLPFSFCYFGNIYNDCIIGSNGQLSFDLSKASSYNGWKVTTPIPNLVDLPGNTICAAFRDIDPSVSGTVFYYFTGTAPCRSLVIYWDDVALYQCNYPHSTFQMVLHETTNYIDVFIQNSSGSCTSWQGGGGIIGIQDASASLGYSPAGRNGGPWAANNEGWRFAATGAPTYSVSWAGPSGNIGSGLTTNVCPSATTNYTATMTLSDCNAITSVYTSVVQVSVVPYPNLTVSSSNICQGASATLNTSGANTYTWFPGNTNGNSITVSPTATTIYTVSGTSGLGCVASKTTAVTINPNPTITVNSGAICSGQSFTMNPSGASTYSYSSGSSIVNPTSNTSYTVTGSSAAGCLSASGAISNVTIYTTPTISVNSGTICSGQSFTIIPSGANTYTYSSGSPIVSPLINTSYVITGSSINGCASLSGAISNVVVNTTPVISVNSGAICSGQSFTIVPSGANTYTYSSGSNIVSPLSNSSYTITGSGIGGCVGTSAAISNVTVNPTPVITVNSGAICSGQGFTIIPNGASSYTYSSGSPFINPTNSSSYSIIGTNLNGCVSAVAAISNVTVNPNPVITVNSGAICSGQSFTITPSGANTYTYSSGTPIVSPLSSTSYVVTGTSLDGCVSTSGAISNVVVNTTPVISVNSGAICTGQSFTITPSGASSYTYSSGSNIVSPISNSSYTITGSGSGGCIGTSAAISNVTVNPNPIITVNSGAICSGQSFTITPNGANTYTFSSGSPIVNPLNTSAYIVTGTSLDGCVTSSGVVSNVTVNPNPTITVNSGAICSGQSFSITPSGANTYTFSSGSAIVSPLNTSAYIITGTSLDGCIGTSAAISNVTVNPNPTITVNSGAICSGQSFTILPSGATTYTYSSGSAIVNPLNTSTYVITGTSSDGCVSASAAVSNVTVNPNPIITVNSGAICPGQGFTITPSGANTYSYSSGSPFVNPTNNASYTVTGTSADGCLSSVAAISSVTVSTTPVISVNSGAICSGQSFTINPSGATSYSYSSGSPVVNPLSSTSYTVIGTSANGCIGTGVAISNVTVNPNPVVTVNSGAICTGQSFTITPSGANTYSYSSGSNIVNPTSTSSYTVTGTSIDGCLSAGSAVSSISVNSTPTISVNSGAICNGQSFTISPSGAATYSYSSGSNVVNPSASVSYTVNGTSPEGCVAAAIAVSNVTVNPNPIIGVNSGAVCLGQSFTITPTGADTYSFSSGSNIVSPSSNAAYTVTGASNAGCISANVVISNVTVNPIPVLTVNSGSICLGQNFLIIPNGANTYTFSSGSNIVSPTITTSYTVTGTSAEGCTSPQAVVSNVVINATPLINADNGVMCSGQNTTQLSVTSLNTNLSYAWSGPSVVSGSNTPNPTVAALGVYTILVTDNGSSCISSQTLTVNNASVIAQFTANPYTGPAPLNVGFTNQSVGATNYSWNFGNGNSSALSPNNTYFASGNYTVVLTALSGACTSTTSMEIKVLEPLGIIPELFTPNGDPFNPTFEIKGLDFYTNNSLEVFNRWGNPVYSAKPYKNDWDGTANAQGSMGSSKLPSGTYFYILNIGDEAKTIYRGYVQIEY